MNDIRYTVEVFYTDFLTGVKASKAYNFMAQNEECAKKIALELHLLSEGLSDDMEVIAKPVVVTGDTEKKIDKLLVQTLKEVGKAFGGKTYGEFLELYQKLDGRHLQLGDRTSFVFDIMGFTLGVSQFGEQVEVSKSEIVYATEGRRFIIRNGVVYQGN